MAKLPFNTALIIGVGPDISASLARRLSALPVGDGCIEVERRIPFGDLSPSIVPKRNYLAVDLTVSQMYAIEKSNIVRCLDAPETIEWE